MYGIVYTVELTNYSAVVSAQSAEFVYTIVDSCLLPGLTLNAPAQPIISDHHYPVTLTITPNAYIPSPSVCTVSYECSVLSGPSSHFYFSLCSFAFLGDYGYYFASTGVFHLSTSTPIGGITPPGAYTIQILGRTGTNSDVTAYHDFNFNLVDPCAPPASVTRGPMILSQTYMLTSAPIEAIVSFVVDPSYCTLTSTYTGSDSSIIAYAADTQTVTIYNDSDLSLSGPLAPPYEQYIRVDILGNVDTASDTSSFILTVQNPCPHLATISTPSNYSVDYPVY